MKKDQLQEIRLDGWDGMSGVGEHHLDRRSRVAVAQLAGSPHPSYRVVSLPPYFVDSSDRQRDQQLIDINKSRTDYRFFFHLFSMLIRTFELLTVRLARIVVNAYLENVDLVARTLQEFGDDAASAPPRGLPA